MKALKLLALACTIALPFTVNSAPAQADEAVFADPSAALLNRCAFQASMRKLWEDHITWTRMFIISDAKNLPDKAVVTQRLMQNQRDIGAAIIPFYGRQPGAKLTNLLYEHIRIAAQVVDAAKAQNANQLRIASALWFANGDAIAAFLASANPQHWMLNDMKSMMRKHLQLTSLEATDYLQGRYAASAADYDRVHEAMLAMADMLSQGIILQFPQMFQ